MNLVITIRKEGNVTVVCLAGELTVNNARLLRKSIQKQMDGGTNRFSFDLSALDRIDSAGLGELVSIYTALRSDGGSAHVSKMSPEVRTLFQTSRLQSAFEPEPQIPEYNLRRRMWIRTWIFWIVFLLTSVILYLVAEYQGAGAP